MELAKKTKLLSKVSLSTIMLLFTALIFTNCNQDKKEEGDTTDTDTTANSGQAQSAQDAMQSLQGDTAMQDIEVSDEELETFASVVQELQKMQSSMNQDMVDAVEGEGMGIEEFNRIMKHQQTPEAERSDSVEISDESMSKFESASEELQSIQAGSQQKFMKVLEEKGMDFKRYRQISMALRQDQELMQRFQALRSQNQGPQQNPMSPQ